MKIQEKRAPSAGPPLATGLPAHIASSPLASLATHAISSPAGAATHAHGGKLHGKSGNGDSFADLLAAADDAAADDQATPTAPVPGNQAAQPAAKAQTSDDSDGEDGTDTADNAFTLSLNLPASNAVQAKPLPTDATADKTDAKNDADKPAANDNDGAAQPLLTLPQPVAPQPQAQSPSQTQPQDQAIAPLAANAPAAVPQTGLQTSDADQSDDENETAAAPLQAAAAPDKPAPAAASKSAADFKKILNDSKPTTAKPATADAVQARDTDTANSTGKTDAQQADARPAPTQAAAHTDSQPNAQPDALAVNAPQQPSATAVQAATAPAHLPPAAHQAANMQGLAVEIAARSQSGSKQFDIRLDPPELGRVEVRLSIDATGKAEAHLTADQPQTLDLLQKDAPALTRALREAGLDVSQDGLNFSLRQQQQQAGQDQPQFQSSRTLRAGFTGNTSNETASAGAAYSRSGQSLLDIRV
jgi:flagellar hook-length control protein FliK